MEGGHSYPPCPCGAYEVNTHHMTTPQPPTREPREGSPPPPTATRQGLPNPGLPAVAPPPRRLEITVPISTILVVFAALLGAYAFYVLWPLVLLVFLALFLAVTLHSFVDRLCGRGMKRWVSLWLVIGGLWIVISVGMALLVPAMIDQVASFSRNFPQIRDNVLNHLPAGGSVRLNVEHLLDNSNWPEPQAWFGHFLSVGGIALNGISEIALVLVIALYLLIDGSKTYEWLLAFFSPFQRRKLRDTAKEISKMIFGYVSGQVITSVLVMIYTYIVLSVLRVPGALTLAILAGVLDILPILGFIISTVPAVLLALTVSPKTAVVVLTLYLLFHLFESYFIIPKVYGKNLRLSTLTVLLGLLAGVLIAGIPGSLAALPVIASYAAIERIWLKPFLRDGVSEKHELQKDAAFGEEE
jgi:predicted PurR-regulated permease PerM